MSTLAPVIAFTSLLLAFAIVPVAQAGWSPSLQHRDPVLPDDGRAHGLRRAVHRLVSNDKYSLLGAMRRRRRPSPTKCSLVCRSWASSRRPVHST
ncbi:hypothetical protein ACNKHQ_13580 [Shigella flexneri]